CLRCWLQRRPAPLPGSGEGRWGRSSAGWSGCCVAAPV
ncbi:MAG: hypothetical protein AVDCRST_MAG33-668, partial [uncultured Thermomicrobiales bacterium]